MELTNEQVRRLICTKCGKANQDFIRIIDSTPMKNGALRRLYYCHRCKETIMEAEPEDDADAKKLDTKILNNSKAHKNLIREMNKIANEVLNE